MSIRVAPSNHRLTLRTCEYDPRAGPAVFSHLTTATPLLLPQREQFYWNDQESAKTTRTKSLTRKPKCTTSSQIKGKDRKDMPEATWKPHEKHGRLTMQSDLPDSVYAFPKQRKEPLTDAQHVRNAVARFNQVIDVSNADRALAFVNIETAANHYDVKLAETSWRDLGIHPRKSRRGAATKGRGVA